MLHRHVGFKVLNSDANIQYYCSIKNKTRKILAEIPRGQLVRMKGLEPPRLTTLDPKSNAATNYATCAVFEDKIMKNVL